MVILKKYVALVVATLLLTGGAFFAGEAIKRSVPFVPVSKIESTTIEDTVVCSGKVEYFQSRDIRTLTGGTIETLSVKKGDKVKAGQALATVIAKGQSENTAEADKSENSVNTQEIYQAVINGDYSVLDNYDALLESAGTGSGSIPAAEKDFVQTVTSPISGTVKEIHYLEQEYAPSGEVLLTVVSDGRLQVTLPVSEAKISEIQLGQQAVITGSGFKGSVYKGEVTSIDNEAKQTTTTAGKETTVDVTVSIKNPGKDIKPGYTAKCTITSAVKTDALLLPYQAVLAEDNGKEFVYLYDDGKAAKKYVETDGEYTDGLEVLSGIEQNDFVITTPDHLSDKAVVKLKEESAVVDLA